MEGTFQRLWLKELEFTEWGVGECVEGVMPGLSTDNRKSLKTAPKVLNSESDHCPGGRADS